MNKLCTWEIDFSYIPMCLCLFPFETISSKIWKDRKRARKLGHMVLIVLLLNLPLINFFKLDIFMGAKQKTFAKWGWERQKSSWLKERKHSVSGWPSSVDTQFCVVSLGSRRNRQYVPSIHFFCIQDFPFHHHKERKWKSENLALNFLNDFSTLKAFYWRSCCYGKRNEGRVQALRIWV